MLFKTFSGCSNCEPMLIIFFINGPSYEPLLIIFFSSGSNCKPVWIVSNTIYMKSYSQDRGQQLVHCDP
jgi:hypothetical protein